MTYKKKPQSKIQCQICGSEFQGRINARFCVRCRKNRQQEQTRLWLRDHYHKDKEYKSLRNVKTRKYYRDNRESILVKTQQYYKTPNGKLSHQQCSRRRRELKKNYDYQFTNDNIQTVYSRFNNQCFNCGLTERLEIDHHYPLSSGHKLTLDNAVLLCKSCNSSKSNKSPEDFYTLQQLVALEVIMDKTS